MADDYQLRSRGQKYTTYMLELCGIGTFNVNEGGVRINNPVRDEAVHL